MLNSAPLTQVNQKAASSVTVHVSAKHKADTKRSRHRAAQRLCIRAQNFLQVLVLGLVGKVSVVATSEVAAVLSEETLMVDEKARWDPAPQKRGKLTVVTQEVESESSFAMLCPYELFQCVRERCHGRIAIVFFSFLTPSWEAKQLRLLCFRKFKIPLVLFVISFCGRRMDGKTGTSVGNPRDIWRLW
jgi:hypothetical protein